MDIKALFFDFGGTIDLYPFVEEDAYSATAAMISLLKKEGIDIEAEYTVESFYKLVAARNKDYKRWKTETLIELSGEQVWKEYILSDEKNRELLSSETAEELCFLIETGYHTRRVRPEMGEVMEELSQLGLIIGIISNVLSKTQVPRNLVDYNLEKYFSPVILSAEFGRVKPKRSIFKFAADEAGVLPEECVYIGNSLSKDVFGAKNAGYKTAVQIEYPDSDETEAPAVKPDFYIKSMNELPEIIYKLLSMEKKGEETGIC